MIHWYEQTLDWLIAHTTIEMAFCLFLVAMCGAIVSAVWVAAIASKAEPLNSDIQIFEAIQKAREPHTHWTTPATRK